MKTVFLKVLTFAMLSMGTFAFAAVPNATSDIYLTNTGASLFGNVLTNDTGDAITVTSNTLPSNGTLISGVDSEGRFIYNPAPGYNGTDSFTYTITDSNSATSTATVTITIQAPVVIPANLVAEYRLDECAFDGTVGDVIDNSVNLLHGTSFNTTTKTTEPNKICKGATFNGTSNYISVPDNTNLNITGSMTISFWVYPIRKDVNEYYVSKRNPANNNGWEIMFNSAANNTIEFRLNLAGTNRTLSVSKPNNWRNNWHMITAVYNSSTGMQLYITDIGPNGSTRTETNAIAVTGTVTTSVTPMLFAQYNNGNYFQGNLDEIKIFKTAFSAAEVTTMYNNESALRNWNNTTTARVCNTCTANVSYTAGGNFWNLISLQSDFRSAAMTAKTTSAVLGDNLVTSDYDPSNTNPNGWILIRRDYTIGTAPTGSNNATYHVMGINENLEYGKAYWLGSKKSATWDANLKTMDFNVVNNSACRSSNGKCILIDLEEPNGTNNNGSFIYTMTSFPIAKPIKWSEVRILINGVAYTPDLAQNLGQTFNATIWEYDPASKSYITVTPATPGQGGSIKPHVGYWIELDKNAAGKTVQLLVPQG